MITRAKEITVEVYQDIETDMGDAEIEWRMVARDVYHDPGKLYGPPEDCYPPEAEIGSFELFRDDVLVPIEEHDFYADIIAELEEKVFDELWSDSYDDGREL